MENLCSNSLLSTSLVVEIFKTNVQTQKEAKVIISELETFFKGYVINFDLEDCDRILRIEGGATDPELVISVLTNYGLECSVLDD